MIKILSTFSYKKSFINFFPLYNIEKSSSFLSVHTTSLQICTNCKKYILSSPHTVHVNEMSLFRLSRGNDAAVLPNHWRHSHHMPGGWPSCYHHGKRKIWKTHEKPYFDTHHLTYAIYVAMPVLQKLMYFLDKKTTKVLETSWYFVLQRLETCLSIP